MWGVNYFVPIGMKSEKPRPRGRPRAFDRDEVLDRAIITFWACGYSGASIDNLTDSMGINRPSLYATFGSKHDLFMEVVDRYASTFGRLPISALKSNLDARKAVAAFFEVCVRRDNIKKPLGIGLAAKLAVRIDHRPNVCLKGRNRCLLLPRRAPLPTAKIGARLR